MKTKVKFGLILLIIIIILVGGLVFLNKIKPSDLRYCKTDNDCEMRRVNCDGCNFEIKCVNEKWDHCIVSVPEGEFCPPAPPWVTNCRCIDSRCVDCRGNECKTGEGS